MGENILRLTGEAVCVAGVVAGENSSKLRKKRSTAPARWTTNPVWNNEMLTFDMGGQLAGLRVECWGKDKSGKVCVGQVFLPRSSLPLNCDAEGWYTLLPLHHGKDHPNNKQQQQQQQNEPTSKTMTNPESGTSGLRLSISAGELYLRLWYHSVPTASPVKERIKLRRRSSSLLRRQKRKELERIFPLSSDEELLRTKKCYLSKEKGRLYVTNLHLGFYEKKKAGVWLEYSQILHISAEGSDLTIVDHNANEYCFHEGAKVFKPLYAQWRGISSGEDLASTEESDSLGSDPSSPSPNSSHYIRSMSDPPHPAMVEGELSTLRTMSSSDGCLQSKLAPDEAPAPVTRKRLSGGLRHFLRPAEISANKHTADQSPTPLPPAQTEVDKNNNNGLHPHHPNHRKDRISRDPYREAAEGAQGGHHHHHHHGTPAIEQQLTRSRSASSTASNEGLITTSQFCSSETEPTDFVFYRTVGGTFGAAAEAPTSSSTGDGMMYDGDEVVRYVDKNRHNRKGEEYREDGEGDGELDEDGGEEEEEEGEDEDEEYEENDEEEEEEEEEEDEELLVSLSSGGSSSGPKSLSSIAVSIALGAPDDIVTEQLHTSTTASTARGPRTTSMAGFGGEWRSDGEISSQIRLLIKSSKSSPSTLVVKVISGLHLGIPHDACDSVFVQVQYARQTKKTEAVQCPSQPSLFFNQKIKFNWIGGKSEFIDATCWYVDAKRRRDVFVGQAIVPLPSPVHGVRSYRIDGWYELVDRRVKANSQIHRRIGGVVRLPSPPNSSATSASISPPFGSSNGSLSSSSSDAPSDSGSVVIRTGAVGKRRGGPDLHGSVIIHSTGSEDQVGTGGGSATPMEDERTVVEQPFTDTVDSYSFDDCDDYSLKNFSLSPRSEEDMTTITSRSTSPRQPPPPPTEAQPEQRQQTTTTTTMMLEPSSSVPATTSASAAGGTAAGPPHTTNNLQLLVVFLVLLVGVLFEIARRDL